MKTIEASLPENAIFSHRVRTMNAKELALAVGELEAAPYRKGSTGVDNQVKDFNVPPA